MDDQPKDAADVVGPAPEMPVFYANASRNLGGAFDVRLEFGHQRGDDEPAWVAGVIMSWEHAQALWQSLDRMLREFQEKAGPLPNVSKAGAAQVEGGSE